MKDKIKVLMIGPDRSVHGGISGVVNNYYAAGLDEKIDLCYIGTMVEGSGMRKLLKAVEALLLFFWRLPRYDIAHINVASDSSYYRKSVFIHAAALFRKKIVIHQHGGDFEGFYRKELSERGRKRVQKTLSLGSAFLVLAPAWKEFFATVIEKDKITVFPDSIEIPKPVEKNYGQQKILFLGRLCKAKGVRELLTAMSVLKKRCPDCMLYLGGIWEDKELEQLAGEQKDCVVYIGWVSGTEKKKYLEECDIFVLPSYFEGQSLSVLEAMANSCAVAASDTGGIPEMIINGETGLLFRPEDTQDLTEKLDRLLFDTQLCRRLGESARMKAEEEFSIDKNIEKLLQIYDQILAE